MACLERDEIGLAKFAQRPVDVDGGHSEDVRQFVLGKGTLISSMVRQANFGEPLLQLEQEMGGAADRVPPSDIHKMFGKDGIQPGQGAGELVPETTFRQGGIDQCFPGNFING